MLFSSFLWFDVGGQLCSNFLASTVQEALRGLRLRIFRNPEGALGRGLAPRGPCASTSGPSS